MSSTSMAFTARSSTQSAARTRLAAGAPGSTMIFSSTVTAALAACCSRAIDCPNAARRAARY